MNENTTELVLSARQPSRNRPRAGLARRLICGIAITVGAAVTGTAAGALDQVRQEPNLEKRSKLALENAEAAFKDARNAHRIGDTAVMAAKVNEVEQSVGLAFTSLNSTGKNPRRSPKYFKQAEMETRALARRLDEFQHEMTAEDRSTLDSLRAKVQQVHDELLTGLMGGKSHR